MGRFDYPSPYWDFVGDPALDLIDNMLVVDAVKRFSPLECLTHPWMLVKPWSELLNDAARSFQSPGLRHDAGINISSANEHSAVETTREAIESEGGLRDMSPVEWKAFYLAFDDQRIQKANSNRSTPLHLALEDDRLDLVDWLLEKGADIEAPDSCGTTPLGEACSSDRVKLLELLIAKGLSSSSLQFSGLSLLHWAFEADPRLLSHKEIVQLLLKDERTDVEAQDNNLRTPLIIAAARGYIEAVQLLLEHGALPNAKDRYHSTPLIAAVRNGHKAVVQHFLEIDGIEVDFGRTLNQTLFLWAKQSGSAEVVELLQRYAKKVGIKISESEQNMECSPDTWGFASRYCDICYRFISSGPYYRCEICAGGDFDICLKCSEGDFQCQDSSHSWVLSQ
jgi:hypothetical protein